jgi:polyisoprenoid-binding protein YceI
MSVRRLRTSRLALSALAVGWLGPSIAYAAVERSGTPSIAFHATTNAEATIDGTSSDLTVSDDGATVTFAVPVSSLKTGIALRDTHLRKYLGADAHPTLSVSVVRSELTLPSDGQSVSATAGANVVIHGTKKYEKVAYSLARKGDAYSLTVKGLVVKLQDYGIEQPSFAGVKVHQAVSIDVSATLRDAR